MEPLHPQTSLPRYCARPRRNLLADLFLEFRGLARGEDGGILLEIVEDQGAGIALPLLARSDGINRKLKTSSASSCDFDSPLL